MTNEEKAAFLATGMMGWEIETFTAIPGRGNVPIDATPDELPECDAWMNKDGEFQVDVDSFCPDTDRNWLALVLAALTKKQQRRYLDLLEDHLPYEVRMAGLSYSTSGCDRWLIHTADPAVCVDALIESLGGTP